MSCDLNRAEFHLLVRSKNLIGSVLIPHPGRNRLLILHTPWLIKHKCPYFNTLSRNTRSSVAQIKRAMWNSQALALFRVEGVENGHLRVELVRDVVPSVIWVVVDLEDLVCYGREDLVNLEKILLRVNALGVEECKRKVSAGPSEWLPDTE